MSDLRALAARAGGTFNGREARIPGPGHGPHDNSLSVTIGNNGRLIWYSFCGDSDEEIRGYLKALGMEVEGQASAEDRRMAAKAALESSSVTSQLARKLWDEGLPLTDTIAARYLADRGIAPPCSPSLRFHPRCKDGPFYFPAMIAARTQLDTPDSVASIHRIFLSASGEKRTKRSLGACKGGGVVLATVGEELLVAEGIETALSASAMFGLPAIASLGATFTRMIIIPKRVRLVLIAADNDKPGLLAAHALAARLRVEGRNVRIETPPLEFKDFNDLRRGKRCGGSAPYPLRSFRGGEARGV